MNDVIKKNSRKKQITLIASGVILIGSIAAYAGSKSHWHHGDRMAHMIEHISKDLSLNDVQSSQLDILDKALHQAKRALRGGDDIDIVLASIQGQSLDQSALNALIETKLDTTQAQAPQLIVAIANFYDGLNAEQQMQARDKLESLAERIRAHRHDHD